jgi:hypothetical protein
VLLAFVAATEPVLLVVAPLTLPLVLVLDEAFLLLVLVVDFLEITGTLMILAALGVTSLVQTHLLLASAQACPSFAVP